MIPHPAGLDRAKVMLRGKTRKIHGQGGQGGGNSKEAQSLHPPPLHPNQYPNRPKWAQQGKYVTKTSSPLLVQHSHRESVLESRVTEGKPNQQQRVCAVSWELRYLHCVGSDGSVTFTAETAFPQATSTFTVYLHKQGRTSRGRTHRNRKGGGGVATPPNTSNHKTTAARTATAATQRRHHTRASAAWRASSRA